MLTLKRGAKKCPVSSEWYAGPPFQNHSPIKPPSPQHSACAVFGHNRLLLRLWTCVLYWETLDFGFTSSHLGASVNTAAVLWCWPGLIMICSTPQASHPFRLRGWQALSIFGCISSRPHADFLQRFRLTHGALLSLLILGVGGTHLSHWKSFFLPFGLARKWLCEFSQPACSLIGVRAVAGGQSPICLCLSAKRGTWSGETFLAKFIKRYSVHVWVIQWKPVKSSSLTPLK